MVTLQGISPDGKRRILSLINVTGRVADLEIPVRALGLEQEDWYDLVSGMEWMEEDGVLRLNCLPYDILWLTPLKEMDE